MVTLTNFNGQSYTNIGQGLYDLVRFWEYLFDMLYMLQFNREARYQLRNNLEFEVVTNHQTSSFFFT